MKKLVVDALTDNLDEVIGFVSGMVEEYDCPFRLVTAIELTVEEIFVNIAHYAYAPGTGKAEITADVGGDPLTLTVTFEDSGVPYDPLAKEDPDVTLPAAERQIGGLGIFLVKKNMDDVLYEYRNGKNVLTIIKKLA